MIFLDYFVKLRGTKLFSTFSCSPQGADTRKCLKALQNLLLLMTVQIFDHDSTLPPFPFCCDR